MPWTGLPFEQLGDTIYKIDDLRYKKQQQGLAEMA
jgi:hypothetical protein